MYSRFLWTILITDARGRRVPLAGPRVVKWTTEERKAMTLETTRLMTWHILPKGRLAVSVILVIVGILLFAPLPALMTFGAPSWLRGTTLIWLAIPGGLVLGLAQSWFFVNISRWVTADITAQVFVAIGRCASCAYPLETSTPPDGYTICPECGAAWKLDELAVISRPTSSDVSC